MINYNYVPLWESVSSELWSDWRWQFQNSITTRDALQQVLTLSDNEMDSIGAAIRHVKMSISPHIATLMDPSNSSDPLRKQFLPSQDELAGIDDEHLYDDVDLISQFSPVDGIIHRYPTKVLLMPTTKCASYCRYCFRRRFVGTHDTQLTQDMIDSAIDYIRDEPSIEEVILSGGDPLTLSDVELEYILNRLSTISHVRLMRIHTRMPVTIPFRITSDLVSILSKYKPIYIVVHIDTPHEFSDPFRQGLSLLIDNGIPCLASCPLLRGINDSEVTLRTLWTELVAMRVKPYYLFHSDPVKGTKHFLVRLCRGIEIMRNLYDRMSGLAMPHYCMNAPDGGGHILINMHYITPLSEHEYVINTYDGKRVKYVDAAGSP